MKAAEREERNATALRLFISGATYREIGAQLAMRPAAVGDLVERELAAAARRRILLSDQAYAVNQERQEALLAAHMPTALDPASPDRHRSALVCQRVLAAQSKLLDIAPALPAPTSSLPGDGDPAAREEAVDDLARLRAERGLG